MGNTTAEKINIHPVPTLCWACDGILGALSHFILLTTQSGSCYYDHPHFTDEETEALSLAQGQLISRGGNDSEPHCPTAPSHPKDQSVQPLPTDPLPLGATRAGSAGGSSGLWAESPRIPHLLAQRLLWAEQQRPTAGHAVQEGPRGVRASMCPAVNWWHWT